MREIKPRGTLLPEIRLPTGDWRCNTKWTRYAASVRQSLFVWSPLSRDSLCLCTSVSRASRFLPHGAFSLSPWEPRDRASGITRRDTVSGELHAKTTQGCPLLLPSHRSSSIRKDVKAVSNETESRPGAPVGSVKSIHRSSDFRNFPTVRPFENRLTP